VPPPQAAHCTPLHMVERCSSSNVLDQGLDICKPSTI
jgi:hypothetical protein